MDMNNKKLTNLKAKTISLTTARTKTAIFFIGGAILIATIGISGISSPAPAEADRKGITFNDRAHYGCSSGVGGCSYNEGQVYNQDEFHYNYNCNGKRAENTGVYCKYNEATP